jgi:hypothetical protein
MRARPGLRRNGGWLCNAVFRCPQIDQTPPTAFNCGVSSAGATRETPTLQFAHKRGLISQMFQLAEGWRDRVGYCTEVSSAALTSSLSNAPRETFPPRPWQPLYALLLPLSGELTTRYWRLPRLRHSKGGVEITVCGTRPLPLSQTDRRGEKRQ